MSIWVFGINHKTASVGIREKVAFDVAVTPVALKELHSTLNFSEVVILSTCNRTEFYCVQDKRPDELLIPWLEDFHNVNAEEIKQCCYCKEQEDAVTHLMRVACGLDSLVLGEPQIFGQLKTAFSLAQQIGCVSSELGRLFRHSFNIAKRVRTNTAIGENPVSVAFAAVSMAKHIFADLSQNDALLIGAGETIELVAKHLQQTGIRQIHVANRTLARAQSLALQVHGESLLLEDIPRVLPRVDIVISSTASPVPILGKGSIEKAMRKRKRKPMYMVDIAVPRDIEAEAGELQNLYLYTVDDLHDIIADNVRSREDAAKQAEELIASGAASFMRELRSLDSVEVVTALRQQVEAISDVQLEKALKQLANGENPETVLKYFAHTFNKKLLHAPTLSLRQAAGEGRQNMLETTQELFQLPGSKNKIKTRENF